MKNRFLLMKIRYLQIEKPKNPPTSECGCLSLPGQLAAPLHSAPDCLAGHSLFSVLRPFSKPPLHISRCFPVSGHTQNTVPLESETTCSVRSATGADPHLATLYSRQLGARTAYGTRIRYSAKNGDFSTLKELRSAITLKSAENSLRFTNSGLQFR